MWIIDKIKSFIGGNKKNNDSNIDNIYKEIIDYIEENESIRIDRGELEKIKIDIKNSSKRLYELEYFRHYSKELWNISKESTKPLMLMIMGEFKTGKSTFINAILEEEILKSDVTPATAVVSMISYGIKRTAIAYFKTGETKEYSLKELASITSEGDETKKKLRDNIKYVEVFLPKEILRGITIIDTPGLNVDNELHIQATKEFMNKADLVFWVFAYGKAASKTEIAEIKELSKRLKPIAIINRIDEIDEEEESLEEVIDEIGKRLKSTVTNIIPVSSFLAKKAILENKKMLLDESKWNCFLEKLESEVLQKSEELKLKAIDEKLKEYSEELIIFIKKKKKDLIKLEEKCTNFDYKKLILNKIKKIDNLVLRANNLETEMPAQNLNVNKLANGELREQEYSKLTLVLEFFEEVINDLNGMEDTEKIIVNLNSYLEIMGNYFNNLDKIFSKNDYFNKELIQQEKELESLNLAFTSYNKSGFFGGTPIFDFDGRGARLEQQRLDYNRRVEDLNSRIENHRFNIKNQYEQIIRKDLEMCKYLTTVKKPLIKELDILRKELVEFNENVEKNKKDYEVLKDEITKATKIALRLK